MNDTNQLNAGIITEDSLESQNDALMIPDMEAVPDQGQFVSQFRELKRPDLVFSDRIVSIDGGIRQTDEKSEELRLLYELAASLKSKTILTGTITGVESASDGSPWAVLHRGSYKVVIPYFELISKPEDYRDMNPNEVHHYLLSKRLGAEIEYVVKGIDQQSRLAVASRKDAMAIRRRQYYLEPSKYGGNRLEEGMIAEARIISTIRTGIFVELFGVESFIHQSELSYTRLLDTTQHFRTGERVLVLIRSIDMEDPEKIKAELSVKRTKPNPYENLSERFHVGNNYIGTIITVSIHGVHVALDAGVDCLCNIPVRGIPMIGSRCTVRLIFVNDADKILRGVLMHSSYQP